MIQIARSRLKVAYYALLGRPIISGWSVRNDSLPPECMQPKGYRMILDNNDVEWCS